VNDFGTRAYSKVMRWLGKFFVALLFGIFLAVWFFLLRQWDELDVTRVYIYFGFFLLYLNIEFRTFRGPDEAAYADYLWVRYLLTYSWWFLMLGSLLEHALIQRSIPILPEVGMVLAALGVALGFWSRRTIQSELSPRVETWEKMRIVDKGPYAVIRHPSYMANMLLVVGMPLIVSALVSLAFSVILVLLFIRRLLWEERVLMNRLPAYADYMQQTHRIIPGIW
jgi:protein-S-isoprenylcysteine O-methyltransferase Ste14